MTAVNFNPATNGRRTIAGRTASASNSTPLQDSEPAQAAGRDELDRATHCIRLRDNETDPKRDDAADSGS